MNSPQIAVPGKPIPNPVNVFHVPFVPQAPLPDEDDQNDEHYEEDDEPFVSLPANYSGNSGGVGLTFAYNPLEHTLPQENRNTSWNGRSNAEIRLLSHFSMTHTQE